MHLEYDVLCWRILAAFVCGLLLGMEREYKGRDAGLKTHISLCMACSLAVIVSAYGFGDVLRKGMISLDASRVSANVVSGIGFACAAVIWRNQSRVSGLTTAMNMFATGIIGMACGGGLFFAAFVVTGAMLFVHLVVGRIERRIFPLKKVCTITIDLVPGATGLPLTDLDRLAKDHGAVVIGIQAHSSAKKPAIEVKLDNGSQESYLRLMDTLTGLKEVVKSVTCNSLAE